MTWGIIGNSLVLWMRHITKTNIKEMLRTKIDHPVSISCLVQVILQANKISKHFRCVLPFQIWSCLLSTSGKNILSISKLSSKCLNCWAFWYTMPATSNVGYRSMCHKLTVSPGRGMSLPSFAVILIWFKSSSRALIMSSALSISRAPHASWACEQRRETWKCQMNNKISITLLLHWFG